MDNSSPKKVSSFAAFLMFSVLLPSCRIANESLKDGATPEKRLLSAPSLVPLHFKPGHPEEGESLMDSLVVDDGRQSQVLQENLRTMQSVYGNVFRFGIAGFASPSECEFEACIELAKRRAELMREWLIKNDVSAEKLLPIKALGSVFLIGDESAEDGRRKNMRAEIEVLN